MASAVQPPQAELSERLWTKINNKTKPSGALGQIEQLAHQIGMLQGTDQPALGSCQLMIFAADHGLTEAGVSAYPQAVTRQMVLNFLAGGGAANVFAHTVGVSVAVIDAGVAGPAIEHPQLINRRIGCATANVLQGAAMSAEQRDRALDWGRELAANPACDAIAIGEMGIGNSSIASLLCHKLLGLPLADLVGRGSGLDEGGLQHKRQILEQAADRTPARLDGKQALAEYGGFEIAMAAGAMMGAAQSGKLVLVDGFISSTAAAVALQLQADIRPALVFTHRAAEAGHSKILAALHARALLDLDMRLGEGTGALLAWPVCRCAVAMLNSMASFASAGVSGPQPGPGN